MSGLGGGDDGRIGGEWEVNARIGDQVGGELVKIHIESPFKPERGRN